MTRGEPARPPVRATARGLPQRRRIALTGGIGSGKTAVSDLLRQHGAVVIDSDELAREVVAPGTPGLAAVTADFGPDVLAADGSLDRAALGRVVFADPDARRRLEGIVHPLVRERAGELERAVPAGAVVVHVIPLLVETGQEERFPTVVVVDVPEDVQVARLVARGLTEDDARARMAAQSSRTRRLAVADHVLDNAGPPEDLERAVAALWRRLRQDADMDDKDITGHIQELVDEENRLRVDGGEGLTDAERHARLTAVEERLDQYWDLLRQRRAREEFGADPDVAARRPVDEVESYEQ